MAKAQRHFSSSGLNQRNVSIDGCQLPRQVDDLLSRVFGLVPFASRRAAGQWRRGSQRPADFKFQRNVGASAAAATPHRLAADEFDELFVEPVVFQIPPLECVLELILFEVGVARQLADVFARLLQFNLALAQTHRHLSLFFHQFRRLPFTLDVQLFLAGQLPLLCEKISFFKKIENVAT